MTQQRIYLCEKVEALTYLRQQEKKLFSPKLTILFTQLMGWSLVIVPTMMMMMKTKIKTFRFNRRKKIYLKKIVERDPTINNMHKVFTDCV